jgi:Fic family protein
MGSILPDVRGEGKLQAAGHVDSTETASKSERKGWQWLTAHGKAKSGEYAAAVGVEVRTARRHLRHFEELGLVKKTGSGPSLQYEVK